MGGAGMSGAGMSGMGGAGMSGMGGAGMSGMGGAGMSGMGGAGMSGMGGAGMGGAGAGGTAGASGGMAGSGGSGQCMPPSGTTCATASEYCQSYSYVAGDVVVATCTVTTAGCFVGLRALFACVANCNMQVPGGPGFVDESRWDMGMRCQ
jgi:hypothetical protein